MVGALINCCFMIIASIPVDDGLHPDPNLQALRSQDSGALPGDQAPDGTFTMEIGLHNLERI